MTGASGEPLTGVRVVEPSVSAGGLGPGDPDRDGILPTRHPVVVDVGSPDGRTYGGTTSITAAVVGRDLGL